MVLDYFLQTSVRDEDLRSRLLVVKKSASNTVVFSRVYYDSEGTRLVPLNYQDRFSPDKIYQWTGEVFKDKSPIIFGFSGHSFGCRSIDFISKTEPPIYTRCDNRH